MRRPVSGLGVLILAAALLAGCAPRPGAGSSVATPTPVPTSAAVQKPVYTVQRGEVVRQISFTGRVAPVEQAELFFRTGGRVRHVLVKVGDTVKPGQVLADLEIDDLERQLAAAQSELDAAQRQLEFDTRRAKASLEIARLTLEQLKSQGANTYQVSIQELRLQLAQIDLDELASGVDPRLTNRVEELQAAIAEAQIISPIAGQVLSLSLTEGYAIEAYKPLAIVADTSRLEVSADLQDYELAELQQGMAVSAVLVSRPGQAYPGTVREVPYPGAKTTSGVADKTAHIALDASASEAGYALGDLVRVTVVLERKPDALWLPPQAIRKFEGRRFVIVQQGSAQARLDVKVGIESDDRVEILEGVQEGQAVLEP